jgi:hypothetical protein
MGPVTTAALGDTCGDLIQIAQTAWTPPIGAARVGCSSCYPVSATAASGVATWKLKLSSR